MCVGKAPEFELAPGLPTPRSCAFLRLANDISFRKWSGEGAVLQPRGECVEGRDGQGDPAEAEGGLSTTKMKHSA